MFHLCRSTGTCPSGWFQFVLAGCGSCGPTSAPPRPELGFERPTAVIANRPAAMRGARLAGAAVVVALDRLGRFLSGVIRTLEDLTAAGVLLRSPREGIDYAISAGKVLAGIFAALAGYERDLMHERAAAARHAALARGQHVGRPPRLTAGQVRQIHALHAAGEPVGQIAATFGVGRSTAYRTLQATADEDPAPAENAGNGVRIRHPDRAFHRAG